MTNQKRGASKLFQQARDAWKPPSRKQLAGEARARGKPADREEQRAQGRAATPSPKPPREAAAPAAPREKLLPGARPLDACLAAFEALRVAALRPAGTYQQELAGQTLVKRKNKQLVVSLGRERGGLSLVCKLPRSGSGAIAKYSWASAAGHGLGKSGWVMARFERGAEIPLRLLLGWVEESHAAVAAPPAG